MGPTALLLLRRKACWGLFRPKNPTASAGCEPANLGTKGQHATSRPPKPLSYTLVLLLNYSKTECVCVAWWMCTVGQQHCNGSRPTYIIIIIIIITIIIIIIIIINCNCHSLAVFITLVQTKQIKIIIHKRNNTKTQHKQYKTQQTQVHILTKYT